MESTDILNLIENETNSEWRLEIYSNNDDDGFTFRLYCYDGNSQFYSKELEHQTVRKLRQEVIQFLNEEVWN